MRAKLHAKYKMEDTSIPPAPTPAGPLADVPTSEVLAPPEGAPPAPTGAQGNPGGNAFVQIPPGPLIPPTNAPAPAAAQGNVLNPQLFSPPEGVLATPTRMQTNLGGGTPQSAPGSFLMQSAGRSPAIQPTNTLMPPLSASAAPRGVQTYHGGGVSPALVGSILTRSLLETTHTPSVGHTPLRATVVNNTAGPGLLGSPSTIVLQPNAPHMSVTRLSSYTKLDEWAGIILAAYANLPDQQAFHIRALIDVAVQSPVQLDMVRLLNRAVEYDGMTDEAMLQYLRIRRAKSEQIHLRELQHVKFTMPYIGDKLDEKRLRDAWPVFYVKWSTAAGLQGPTDPRLLEVKHPLAKALWQSIDKTDQLLWKQEMLTVGLNPDILQHIVQFATAKLHTLADAVADLAPARTVHKDTDRSRPSRGSYRGRGGPAHNGRGRGGHYSSYSDRREYRQQHDTRDSRETAVAGAYTDEYDDEDVDDYDDFEDGPEADSTTDSPVTLVQASADGTNQMGRRGRPINGRGGSVVRQTFVDKQVSGLKRKTSTHADAHAGNGTRGRSDPPAKRGRDSRRS
jgi:hypothetical protein